MREYRLIELATTRYLFISIAIAISVSTSLALSLIIKGYLDLDQLSTVVDTAVKLLGVIIGAIWALNRYYISRFDVPQLRVDCSFDLVEGPELSPVSQDDLLLFRLDIVNTGKAALPPSRQQVLVEKIWLEGNKTQLEEIFRWPVQGRHPTPPVEPGSWSAVNFALPIAPSVIAIRIYIDLIMEGGPRWTWHRSFRVRARSTMKREQPTLASRSFKPKSRSATGSEAAPASVAPLRANEPPLEVRKNSRLLSARRQVNFKKTKDATRISL